MYRYTQLIDIQYCQTIDGKVLIYSSLKEKMWENIPKGILNSHRVGVKLLTPGNFAQLALALPVLDVVLTSSSSGLE